MTELEKQINKTYEEAVRVGKLLNGILETQEEEEHQKIMERLRVMNENDRG